MVVKKIRFKDQVIFVFFLWCFTDSTMVNQQKKGKLPKKNTDRLWNMLNFQAP